MEKEIYEQPDALLNTIDGRISGEDVLDNIFGLGSTELFKKVERIQIVACGTSLHAGRVAANWLSAIADLPCQIDYASEYRYRNPHVDENSILITISQSGETADTLAALNYAKEKKYLATVGICNVPTSTLARESDFVLFTNAGPEIGVASTKAFVSTVLFAIWMKLVSENGFDGKKLDKYEEIFDKVIAKNLPVIKKICKDFKNANDFYFLGRGKMYPMALEGTLKLKEVSYIHAEAHYIAGFKHGVYTLVDNQIPIIIIYKKRNHFIKSVIEEIKTRNATVFEISEDCDENEFNIAIDKIIRVIY